MRLEAVLGQATPTPKPLPNPKLWFKQGPGVYVDVQREGKTFYLIPKDGGSPRKIDEDAANREALAALTPEQQVAQDVLMEDEPGVEIDEVQETIRILGQEPTKQEPKQIPFLPTALATLKHFGCDFKVIPTEAGIFDRKNGNTWRNAPGFRGILREDTMAILDMSTDAYEIVQSWDALSLGDVAARKKLLEYAYAWQSVRNRRIRGIGKEKGTNETVIGQQVGIQFTLPSIKVDAFNGRMQAGGALVTSHDGSLAIRATGCLVFGGVSIFHMAIESWKHTSKVAERMATADEVFSYLVRAARGLVAAAVATIQVPDHEAVDVVLRAIEPKLFAPAPEKGSMPDADRDTLIKLAADKLDACRKRLQNAAERFASKHDDVYLGGFRFVLAAPFAMSNREVSAHSYYDGLARERMTAALFALANHAGMVNAGMVPEA
jgi:hypothetical protein